MGRILTDVIVAAIVAGAVGGVPSTFYLLVTGGDVWEPTIAAGSIVLGPAAGRGALVLAAAAVHGVFSLFWAAALRIVLLAPRPVLLGAIAGAAIAVVDIKVIGGAFPRVAALDFWPQLADHVVFGACAALVLWRRERAFEARIRPGHAEKARNTGS